jgi:fibronectin-binding autotransporter adhesin
MRKSKRVVLAAAAAVSFAGPAVHAATSYTWTDLSGGVQTWTNTSDWSPTGSPIGAPGAGDSANLNVALSSNLSVDVPTGTFYVDDMKLGSTSGPITTDIGNANSGGGTLVFDGGTANAGAYADIYSLGAAGSTNIISAPIELDENGTYLNSNINNTSHSGIVGNYVFTANGSINSDEFSSLQTGIAASLAIDPTSTNNVTLNGPISQLPISATATVSAAIANLMSGNLTLTINGQTTITTSSGGFSTAAQSFTFAGVNGSNTIINGTIVDGAEGDSTISYGYSNPTKTTVYPAISPTFQINGTNTYTGVTTLNMATLLVGSDQAFGIQTATASVGSQGEIRLGGSANEFGYNIESANDSIAINNGIDVSQFLTFEGQHSLTINGYMYQTVNREIVNLLPAGKTLTINGNIYVNQVENGRTWSFDGSGLTVVNGGVFNSGTSGDDTGVNGVVDKNGTGDVLLEGTTGTYNGATTVNGGLLEFATPGSYGKQTGGSAGTSSILVNSGGAVALDSNAGATAGTTDSTFLGLFSSSSTGALALSTLDAAANLNFTTGTLANLASMSVGSDYAGVTYTGTITPANSTYRLGGGGTLTIPNSGGNAITGNGNSLVVTNGGTVALEGSNNYGGTTTIQGVYVISDQTRAATNDYSQPIGAFEPATLSVNQLANGNAVTGSGIGSASNSATNLVISGGTLQYTGSGSSTDHLFTMTPVGATLDASGTGAVDFTNSGALAQVDQAQITGVGITFSATGGVPFNLVTLPSGTSTNELAAGMTVSDSDGAIPAGSTIVGVSPTGFYISNNLTGSTPSNDVLTFGNQNRTLTLTGTNSGQNTLASQITNSTTGKISVNKTGAGTWVLTNSNTYTGGTTVNGGTLSAGNGSSGSATGTGNVTLNGGTLASTASGTVTGTVVVGSGTNAIAPGGVGSIGTLNVGAITTNSNTTFDFDLGAPEVSNSYTGDLINILASGTLSVASGTHIAFGTNPTASGDYELFEGSFGTPTLSNFVLPTQVGDTYSLSTTAQNGFIDLVVVSTGPASLYWDNLGAGSPTNGTTWDTTNNNWNNGSAATTYSNGSAVTFNDTNAGHYFVTLSTTVSPASVTVNSSGNYSITGGGLIVATGGFTKTGTSTLTLGVGLTASSFAINGGNVVLASNTTASSGWTSTNPVSNINVSSLTIAANSVLDISNNHVIIDYGATDPMSTILGYLKSGFNNGAWNGTSGIISSTAQTKTNGLTYSVGWADGNDKTGAVKNLTSGEIELKYTLVGDANLDGTVNGSDFSILAANFGLGVTNWDQGNFLYTSSVNGSDFSALAANFGQGDSGAAVTPADIAALDSFAAANGLPAPTIAAVPEPASIGLLALGTVTVLSRRQRRKHSTNCR